MSLPPLPPATLYDTRQCSNGHTNDAMREYGQQCREAALEQAAKMLETGELRGTEQDIHKIGALLISIAKYIRSLK